MRDLVLGPGLYERFHVGRYVYVDKGCLAKELQQRSCDTLVNNSGGDLVAIEEKIVRWPVTKDGQPADKPYTAVTLELMSCTVEEREKIGWIHKDHEGVADWLNYAMCQQDGTVICYLIPFQELKQKFWPVRGRFDTTTSKQINKTLCSVVGLDWIKKEVGYWRRHIRHPLPEGVVAVLEYNNSHYKKGEAA